MTLLNWPMRNWISLGLTLVVAVSVGLLVRGSGDGQTICAAGGPSLGAAQSGFASECGAVPGDCDAIGGGWTCAEEEIGSEQSSRRSSTPDLTNVDLAAAWTAVDAWEVAEDRGSSNPTPRAEVERQARDLASESAARTGSTVPLREELSTERGTEVGEAPPTTTRPPVTAAPADPDPADPNDEEPPGDGDGDGDGGNNGGDGGNNGGGGDDGDSGDDGGGNGGGGDDGGNDGGGDDGGDDDDGAPRVCSTTGNSRFEAFLAYQFSCSARLAGCSRSGDRWTCTSVPLD